MPINFADLHRQLSHTLYDDVIPFWLGRGIDPGGGLNTCMTEDGTVVSRDKWLWSQWRAVWVFSRLYRRTGEQRFIDIAGQIVRFCCAHGWGGDGWRLCVAGDGSPVRAADSIYVDGFALYGLGEYVRATGDATARQWLAFTARSVWRRLQKPHDTIPHFPYPIGPGLRVHGLPMIFSLCFLDMADLVDDDDYLAIARQLSDEVLGVFYRTDRDVVLERLRADGTEAPSPDGTAIVPGHVIESMWFQIHIGRALSEPSRIDKAIGILHRHLELGWDKAFGGLFLAIDANGSDAVGWSFADYKLWWSHTEAMYGTLCAYESCRQPWCLEWYERVHDYAYAHFPHPSAGEWMQRLRRDGSATTETVALPVKDPFHLPRALILSLEALERMLPSLD